MLIHIICKLKNDKILCGRIFPAFLLGFRPSTAIILYWDSIRDTYDSFNHDRHNGYELQVPNYPGKIILDILDST